MSVSESVCAVEDLQLNIVTGDMTGVLVLDEGNDARNGKILLDGRVFPLTITKKVSLGRFAFQASISHETDITNACQLVVSTHDADDGGEQHHVLEITPKIFPEAIKPDPEIALSICIPTYNRSARLMQAVEGILKSDIEEIEVVVCDNASPDDTLERLAALEDPRLKIFRNDRNIGPIPNFNLTLGYGQGKYVFLTSDEDAIEISALREFMDFLKQNPEIGAGVTSVAGAVPIRETKIIKGGKDALIASSKGFAYLGGFFYRRDLYDIEFLFGEYSNPAFLYPFENIAWSIARHSAFCFYSPVLVTRGKNAISYFPKIDGRHFNHPVNLVDQYSSRVRCFESAADQILSEDEIAACCKNFSAFMMRQNFFFAYGVPLNEKFEILHKLNTDVPDVQEHEIVKSLVYHTMGQYLNSVGEDGNEWLKLAIETYSQNTDAAFLIAADLRSSGDKENEHKMYAQIVDNTPSRWPHLLKILGRLREFEAEAQIERVETYLRKPEMQTPEHILEKLDR